MMVHDGHHSPPMHTSLWWPTKGSSGRLKLIPSCFKEAGRVRSEYVRRSLTSIVRTYWADLHDETRRALIVTAGHIEEGERHSCRLTARKDRRRRRKQALKGVLPPPQDHMNNGHGSELVAASRNVRDSDHLLWLRDYRRTLDAQSQTLIGPMRCDFVDDDCPHRPIPMLQIYDVSVNFFPCGTYLKALRDPATAFSHVEVYGFIAIRDSVDFSRNYIFNRSRDDAQSIDASGGYLCLRNPARGISATDCLIEIDVKIKTKEAKKDFSMVGGSVEAVEQFDPWRTNHVEDYAGRVTFESCVVSQGVEATIHLDFVEVPAGGFHVRMRGSTALSDGFFSFIDERRRECSGFVAAAGKHSEGFVAAVGEGDTLRVDFTEEGRDALCFVAARHGDEEQLYQFINGAVVSVQVYWSTIQTVDNNADK